MLSKKLHKIINISFIVITLALIIWGALHMKTICSEFYNTVILSGAYLGIWKGLKITLILTITGTFFGTILGALICAVRMSKISSLNFFGQFLIAVLRGTPVVMLLMFLYFFVFMDNPIDALYVAIMGYALNTGANMAEIFRTSIEALNQKEIEAARMLGFSKIKVFFYIIIPQSWHIAKPVYESSIISLLQWTSVAGYISVTELTRMINGMGSRIGNPFYSMFLGIVIYLSLAYIVRFIFWITGKRGVIQ